MTAPPALTPAAEARRALRRRLLSARQAWSAGPAAHAAQQALADRLAAVLAQLEPMCLGLYWPVRGEFNPRDIALAAHAGSGCALALPYASKAPVEMRFRPWDGSEPATRDECGLPAPSSTQTVQPDVVLVPCVGFTTEGFRLGYGGGYFDRYLAAHPEVTAIGLAWDEGLVSAAELAPADHDVPLMAVLTPSATWGG
ncbi:MAG: 5-formyltetrahydrofolate cyclo-ligase [Aquabacterium sp.]